jgi:hypothetical protein
LLVAAAAAALLVTVRKGPRCSWPSRKSGLRITVAKVRVARGLRERPRCGSPFAMVRVARGRRAAALLAIWTELLAALRAKSL